MTNRRWGLTLAEMLVVISLILLGLSVVVVNIHHKPTGATGAMGLARQLVAELRGVRSKAKVSGSPRALCIPSNNGASACAQSYYLLHGHGKTAPRRVADISRDFSTCYIFAGICVPSSIGPLTSNPPTLDMAAWLNPPTKDYVLAFNSDGRFYTNDLPHDSAGNTYLVVSDGLGFAAAAAPSGTATMGASPPNYYSLTRANQPWVIKIGSSGSISLLEGFTTPSSTATITRDQPGPPSLPPAPPAVLSTVNNPPVIEDIPSSPVANPAYSPPYEATVPPDGRVALTLQAYDVDGDDLTYTFNSVPLTTAAPGNFTYPAGPRTLQYPNNGMQGQARVDWVPPRTAVTGDLFNIEATVTDEAGLTYTSTGRVTVEVNVRVIQAGTIAYDSSGGIYTMRGDGTSPRQVGTGQWPDLSPDGSRIAFVSTRSQTYNPPGGAPPVTESVKRIYLMNVDGSGVKILSKADTSSAANWTATKNTNDDCPAWSPDGTKIVFARTGSTGTNLQILNANGTWAKQNLAAGTTPSWSEVNPGDGAVIAYRDSSGKISRIKPDGTGAVQLMAGTMPVWRRDGSRLTFLDAGSLKECKPDGTSVAVKSPGPIGRIAFSPKGTEFLAVSGSWPELYEDPGAGSAATSNNFRPALSFYPYDGIVSWSVGR
ncbi:MAG: hypothetical protein U0931_24550 [Vulcanimicrobiota bacterium]